MYVDCDSGTLGFGSELEYWGAPFNISRHNFPVFAMVGCTCPNSQLTMIYRGSGMYSLLYMPIQNHAPI